MNLADATEALDNYLVGAWSATPLAFGNEIHEASAQWVRASVQERSSRQRTIGAAPARKWERQCAVVVQVFSPAEGAFAGVAGGERPARVLAEAVRRLFEGRTISGCKFRAASISSAKTERGSPWLQVNVDCPFYFTETA